MQDALIGVDIGGTRLRAARLNAQLAIELRDETLTLAHEGPAATIARILECVRAVLPRDGRAVRGIGIACPGPLDAATGVVIAPSNLTGWDRIPLVQIVRDAFHVPVYLAKDTNAALLAEMSRGAARGYKNVIFITISTGVGGSVIADGRLLLGAGGMATEVGHTLIIEDGRPTFLELETAGPALARRARERLEQGEASIIYDLVDGDLSQIGARVVAQAAEAGDRLAAEIVRRAGWLIGLGIVNLLHLFNPEIVVIGGSVSKLGELLFAPMREAIEQHTLSRAYWENLRIESAALQDDVGLIGAGTLVLTEGGATRSDESGAQP